jgi:anionic cell wall polymer biosynthesis LytR-Cps2A-Psr (LCP) family protein
MKKPAQRIYDHHTNNRSSFWRKSNRKLKVKRLIGLFVLIVILFALGNLVIKIPSWIRSVNSPFENVQTTVVGSGNVNDGYRTNILLISVSDKNNLKDLAVASFNSNRSSVKIIHVPTSAKVYLEGTDENLSLGGVYFAKPYRDSSFDSIFIVIKEFLAQPLDGYFVFSSNELEFTEGEVSSVKGKLDSFTLIPKFLGYKAWLNENMKTNYSISNLVSLAWSFRQMDKDKVVVLDLREEFGGKQLNLNELDSLLREEMLDNTIVNEGGVVEVTGGSRGLVGRLVNNLGASTISLSSEEAETETKVILGSDRAKIADRLASFLGVKVEKNEIESGADAKVVVGSDFEGKFYGK